ncbi:Imm50 family immunity protein [Pseudomonas leptonychotis]|uniref:Uncharacterized protein n=1 Tax=Pseudomonas leptonychotis TaxID=2448482 RepID=A0A4V4R9R6_9PSED|nr:Imm50 family immunity protein [Pseudomonas leptonychotis]TIH09144.1 hypothetical protein D8779_00010 [Pseudomonas leptonychotis]
MEITKHIEGFEKVLAVLGFWPSFHDAEIISFALSRALPLEVGVSVAKLTVHVRQYAEVGAGTAEYELAIVKSVLVNFIFKGVSDLSLSEFNHQNVINSITFTDVKLNGAPVISVDIESIWGLGGSLQCSSVTVDSVEELTIA